MAARDNFEFIVTLRPQGKPEEVFTTKVEAQDAHGARKAALEAHKCHEIVAADCATPRWRREIGHAILSEKEIMVGDYPCLEVETMFAVVLVHGGEVHASISKVKRAAYYWGVFASKKYGRYGRLRGVAAMWFMTQSHRVGRKGNVSPDSRTTQRTCGAEIYSQATSGVDHADVARKRQAEFEAREEAGRKKLQPRIDAGEFEPEKFESYLDAMMAFDSAKRELGILNGPYFMRLYPKQEVA